MRITKNGIVETPTSDEIETSRDKVWQLWPLPEAQPGGGLSSTLVEVDANRAQDQVVGSELAENPVTPSMKVALKGVGKSFHELGGVISRKVQNHLAKPAVNIHLGRLREDGSGARFDLVSRTSRKEALNEVQTTFEILGLSIMVGTLGYSIANSGQEVPNSPIPGIIVVDKNSQHVGEVPNEPAKAEPKGLFNWIIVESENLGNQLKEIPDLLLYGDTPNPPQNPYDSQVYQQQLGTGANPVGPNEKVG